MHRNHLYVAALALLVANSCLAQSSTSNNIEKNGMTVEWQVEEEHLIVTMQAPTTGWVAIGLNPKNQLAGSSFLMGRVQKGQAEVVDYYTIKPGDVHPVTELGGQSAIGEVSGWEKDGATNITFEIPLDPGGKYHHQLNPGSEWFMHIAYSVDDDFAHHSRMRTVVQIRI